MREMNLHKINRSYTMCAVNIACSVANNASTKRAIIVKPITPRHRRTDRPTIAIYCPMPSQCAYKHETYLTGSADMPMHTRALLRLIENTMAS